jgi:Fur family peroxide stress response transcriptional regulator
MMLKKTKQKEAILAALKSTRSHPTADWIYKQVRALVPNIGLATVYRNLKLLKEHGDIVELDMGADLRRFDAYTENHYHFRCSRCSEVFDIDEQVNKELDERVKIKTGFDVFYHRLEFRGICSSCKNCQLE